MLRERSRSSWPRKAASRTLPVMNQQPAAQPRVPAPTPVAYPNLGRIIAISSGKGGVGKSTVAVNLAVALAQKGARVGLMDADIYGPNIPRMMGVNEPPMVINERIVPLEAHGIKIISVGFLIDREQPAIWRGPIVMKIIGFILIVVGLVMLLLRGIEYTKKEKVLDAGPVDTHKNAHINQRGLIPFAGRLADGLPGIFG